VQILGPAGSRLIDGHLDTGSDDTVFPQWLAPLLGVDLSQASEQDIHLTGRGQSFRAQFLPLELRISDGQETCQWQAIVGFVPLPLRRALLGYAGFLQFFDAEFRGADRQVVLTPNPTFPGRVT
jgi:hypothetical protein